MAHYPLCCGALHIIYVGFCLLVVIVHLGLLYIGRRYSHFSHHCILSCVLSTLCKEVPPSKMIYIYICSSLLKCGLLSYFLSLLFWTREKYFVSLPFNPLEKPKAQKSSAALMSASEREFCANEIKEILVKGLIEPSRSPWCYSGFHHTR